MKRIILSALALVLAGGVASADRWYGNRDTSRHSGGTVVREHRGDYVDRGYRRDNYRRDNYRRDNYRDGYRDRVRYERRPVYVNNGRFVFHGGTTRVYNRPVIRHRYYDYRYRPQIVAENYDPVPGYIWIQGNWNWNGYEWVWTNGYYAPDPSYTDDYYYDNY
ncbi:MAG TPA: hypothetical protein VK427_02935 [Kofleriaceae bacterium]|nr:hypothetical protein [Kofleriaceae bacterium]